MTYEEIDAYAVKSDFVLVRKCGPGQLQPDGTRKVGLLYLHDTYEQECWQNWCELIDVGPDCKYFKPEHTHHGRYPERGGVVWVQDGAPEEYCLDRGFGQECQFWQFRESHIQPYLIENNSITVLGDMVLVATTWVKEQNGVLLSDWSQHYELRGRVVAAGEGVWRVLGEELPMGVNVLFERRVKVFKLAGKYMALVPAKEITAIVEKG